jgi:2'-5' RNA ligase
VSRIAIIQEAAAAVTGVPAFTLAFDRVEVWSGAKVLCLAPSETPSAVIELVSKLRYCLRGEQFKLDEREFRPHVTLARDLPKVRATESIEPLRWKMNEFVLVESRRADNSYSIVGQWPLTSPEGPPT